MLNVTKELTALARKLGYTGKAPDTVAKAINAITASVGEGGSDDSSNMSGINVVELTVVEDNGTVIFTSTKTANELIAMITAKTPVFFYSLETFDNNGGSDDSLYHLEQCDSSYYSSIGNPSYRFTSQSFELAASSGDDYPSMEQQN